MKHFDILKVLSCLIALVSLGIIFSWISGNHLLIQMLSWHEPVRPMTAFCMFASSIGYFALSLKLAIRNLWMRVLVATIGLILLVSMLFAGASAEIFRFLWRAVVFEQIQSLEPSVGTVVSFMCVGLYFLLFDVKQATKINYAFAVLMLIVNLVSVYGHLINNPVLYYRVDGISNGMAMAANVLFLISADMMRRLNRVWMASLNGK